MILFGVKSAGANIQLPKYALPLIGINYLQGKYLHLMVIALVIFLRDISQRIILECIGFLTATTNVAAAAIALFAIIGGLFLAIAIVVSIISCKQTRSFKVGMAWFLQIVVTLLYFFGKNTYAIMLHYGSYVRCYEDCQRVIHYAALSCLALAIVFLTHAFPDLNDEMQKKSDTSKVTQRQHFWHYFLDTVFVFVSANAIYGTLSIIPPDMSCSSYAAALSTVCLVIIVAVGCIKIYMNKRKFDNKKIEWLQSCGTYCIFYFCWSLALLLYLVSDNRLPLELISCHKLNSTDQYTDFVGGTTIDRILRLIGTIFAGALLVLPFGLMFFKKWHTRRSNRVVPINSMSLN